METKSLSQFLCDYFKDTDQVLVNAKWLQSRITESVNNERLMKYRIKELEIKNDRLKMKVEALKSDIILSAFNTDAVYKIDVKG